MSLIVFTRTDGREIAFPAVDVMAVERQQTDVLIHVQRGDAVLPVRIKANFEELIALIDDARKHAIDDILFRLLHVDAAHRSAFEQRLADRILQTLDPRIDERAEKVCAAQIERLAGFIDDSAQEDMKAPEMSLPKAKGRRGKAS